MFWYATLVLGRDGGRAKVKHMPDGQTGGSAAPMVGLHRRWNVPGGERITIASLLALLEWSGLLIRSGGGTRWRWKMPDGQEGGWSRWH